MSAPVSQCGAIDRRRRRRCTRRLGRASRWCRRPGADPAAADNALAASEEFRRTLPPAPLLGERRRAGASSAVRRRPRGRAAARAAVARSGRDAAAAVAERGSVRCARARVAGAVGLAALAAFFMVGTMPQGRREGESGETRCRRRAAAVAILAATSRHRARAHSRRACGARGALRRHTGDGGDRAVRSRRAPIQAPQPARRPAHARAATRSRPWSSAARS